MNTAKKRRPVRVYFIEDDPAELWRKGDTADDLGPEYPGASAHVFRLDGFDESLVVLEDPYGRGLVERIGKGEEPGRDYLAPGLDKIEVDPADRCARCSHVAAQHGPGGGSCGACGCRKYLAAAEPDPED